MKKAIALVALATLAAFPALGQAKPPTYNVVLAGGSEPSTIHIWLTPDGRDYVIDSALPLEVGGVVCTHPEGMPTELICAAPLLAGFQVNPGEGDDVVTIARSVSLPVTLRGGAGDDLLIGGSGNDRLIGGPGEDRLIGRSGMDWLFGGSGADRLIGGKGEDICNGGPGEDVLSSCETDRENP